MTKSELETEFNLATQMPEGECAFPEPRQTIVIQHPDQMELGRGEIALNEQEKLGYRNRVRRLVKNGQLTEAQAETWLKVC